MINQSQISSLSRSIIPCETEAFIKRILSHIPLKKSKAQFQGEFNHTFKEKLILIFLKLTHKIETEGSLPSSVYEAKKTRPLKSTRSTNMNSQRLKQNAQGLYRSETDGGLKLKEVDICLLIPSSEAVSIDYHLQMKILFPPRDPHWGNKQLLLGQAACLAEDDQQKMNSMVTTLEVP